MHHFVYQAGVLHAEAVNLADVAASVGTPFYCYSTATIERHFEVFARAALELLAGQTEPLTPFVWARLTEAFRQKQGLTRFLPARLEAGSRLTPVKWTGSSDIFALSRSNAFLVTDPSQESHEAGEWVRVLLK